MGLAILGAFLFFPTGIFSIIDAARVAPALERGDRARAAKVSSRALTLFWVSVAVFVVLLLLIAAGSSEQQSTY
jgi:interferon-induced transmembrane protein